MVPVPVFLSSKLIIMFRFPIYMNDMKHICVDYNRAPKGDRSEGFYIKISIFISIAGDNYWK